MSKIHKITKILKKSEYSVNQDLIKNYCIDWRKRYFGTSELIVFPKSITALSKVIKVCNKHKIPIVPQGGNTGLVGGSVPRKNKSEIIINLKNINKIRKINKNSFSIIVESGCILESIHQFVKKYNLSFPISIGSRGSCQIGGNIATNAGGLNVLKYGSLRNNIIGLEAVLNNGEIYSNLKNIRKDNSGYDIKQLLIGSEGTLGLITAANIKLHPTPKEKIVIFSSFFDFSDLLDFYYETTKIFNDSITSFEMMNDDSIQIVLKNNHELKPIVKQNNFYCLLEISNFLYFENFNNFVISRLEKISKKYDDIIISKSEYENQKLWNYRELIPISELNEGFIIKHDISIPLENMVKFVKTTEKELLKIYKNIGFINFGHIGDNNLHYNIFQKTSYKNNDLKKKRKLINKIIFENVNKLGGSFSAEHGIGQLRKNELKTYKTKDEIKKMLDIKKIFDPNKIFNPGKLF